MKHISERKVRKTDNEQQHLSDKNVTKTFNSEWQHITGKKIQKIIYQLANISHIVKAYSQSFLLITS